MTAARPVPTTRDVERIVRLGEPALRNLAITQCYADLARAYADRHCPGANWCTFATWASRQAGATIRGEDLREALERTIREWLPEPSLSLAFLTALRTLGAQADVEDVRLRIRSLLDLDALVARSADAVARGNLKVFAEIGHAFASFLDVSDDAAFARFIGTLREGDPPEGQRLLRQAFARYRDAPAEADARARSQRLLLANLEVGMHEQTRLQPEIAEALNAALPAPEELVAQLLRTLLPFGGWWARLRVAAARRFGVRPPLDVLAERVLQDVGAHLRRALTRHLMTLELARGTVLRLGQDLPASFPPSLVEPVERELREFLTRVDTTTDSVRDSAAVDWADLGERMHFIADLFRCFHETEALFDAPLTAQEVERIESAIAALTD